MKNLHAKEIAVVGVSNRTEKIGTKIFRDLLKHGLNVQGINPSGGELSGKKLYKSLRDLPLVPDIVITVVPPHVTERIVDECRQMGVREIWMQPGSESEAAIQKAHKFGMSVSHNACFMVHYKFW
jgi:predicted CoA-binding protein